MIKRIAVLIASIFALAMLVPTPSYAQSTDQTDQSEEDWRRSKKKRSSDRNASTRSLPGLGGGIPIPPLEPIDTLPEDSRRHLQRQRAKVIAEVEFGETPDDVPYEPSEAAKSDPELAAEEEEAWEVIMTDLRGGSGGGEPAASGSNRVAVAGRGGSSAGSVTRGGSSQSAADILAQLKGLQSSGQRPGGGGGTEPRGTGGAAQAAGQAAPQGQQGQGQAGQGQADQGQPGDAAAGQEGAATQSGQDGQGQAGQGQQGDGQEGGAEGDGADNGGGEGDAAADGAASSGSNQPPPGPLDRARSQGPLAPSSGAQSSASDFLKGKGTSNAPPATDD